MPYRLASELLLIKAKISLSNWALLVARVILDEAITNLNPDFFWFGVDEIDLKLGIRTSEFINFVKPFIVNCSEKSPQLEGSQPSYDIPGGRMINIVATSQY
ncbi:hypothetical protein KY285_033941 [Solanum tuberosum]|nr:hypothetical protein KY285_033941 [Solanum tuberosum]